MNNNVDWIPRQTSIKDAAIKMRGEDIGALPIGEDDKLVSILAGRDIVIRCLPELNDGLDAATVKDAMSNKILYCFEDENVEEVASNMGTNQIR